MLCPPGDGVCRAPGAPEFREQTLPPLGRLACLRLETLLLGTIAESILTYTLPPPPPPAGCSARLREGAAGEDDPLNLGEADLGRIAEYVDVIEEVGNGEGVDASRAASRAAAVEPADPMVYGLLAADCAGESPPGAGAA